MGRCGRGKLTHTMFAWFERLVDPYPEVAPTVAPQGFFAFLWACSRGLRKYLLATIVLTGAIGAFEALLFAFMGQIVDWLADVQPAQLWAQERTHLLLLGGVLVASIGLVAVQSMVKQQALFGNFPMLLRWNFHRLMLAQSMNFYQDEFAGRIATKVMQTALAVRDTWLILCAASIRSLPSASSVVAVEALRKATWACSRARTRAVWASEHRRRRQPTPWSSSAAMASSAPSPQALRAMTCCATSAMVVGAPTRGWRGATTQMTGSSGRRMRRIPGGALPRIVTPRSASSSWTIAMTSLECPSLSSILFGWSASAARTIGTMRAAKVE